MIKADMMIIIDDHHHISFYPPAAEHKPPQNKCRAPYGKVTCHAAVKVISLSLFNQKLVLTQNEHEQL